MFEKFIPKFSTIKEIAAQPEIRKQAAVVFVAVVSAVIGGFVASKIEGESNIVTPIQEA